MRRLLRIPSFTSAKGLGSVLRVPTSAVLKDVTANARKRVYTKHGGSWFEYKAARDVILPFGLCRRYAEAVLSVSGGRDPLRIEEENYENAYRAVLGALKRMHLPRTPVVALLGHNDHGKTTLLQVLSNKQHFLVNEGQDGMTQTVRTVRTELFTADHVVTLVDTPGQDIFYRMRNYGAGVADAFVLVVAADEGVQAQTKECIGLIQSHLENQQNSKVVVVINKVDCLRPALTPDARPDEALSHPSLQPLLRELKEYEALDSASFVAISALTGKFVDELRRLLVGLSLQHAPQTSAVCSNDNGLGFAMQSVESAFSPASTMMVAFKGASVGTVLDVERSTAEGVRLHVLLLQGHGAVIAGDCFCTGGWSGSVRAVQSACGEGRHRHALSSGAPLSSLSSWDSASAALDAVGSAGTGVWLTVALDPSSRDPLPLGHEILFLKANKRFPPVSLLAFSSPAAEIISPELEQYQNRANSQTQEKLFSVPSLEGLGAREAVQLVAEQSRLALQFPLARVPADEAARLGLPDPRFKGDEIMYDDQMESEVQSEGEVKVGGDSADDEKDDKGGLDAVQHQNRGSQSRQGKRLVVLKTDTHISLQTVLDALDDYQNVINGGIAQDKESGVDYTFAAATTTTVAATVIRYGAGDVTKTDLLVARAAEAEVLAYKVRVLKCKPDDRNKSQKQVPVKTLTRVQDVIDCILGLAGSNHIELIPKKNA